MIPAYRACAMPWPESPRSLLGYYELQVQAADASGSRTARVKDRLDTWEINQRGATLTGPRVPPAVPGGS